MTAYGAMPLSDGYRKMGSDRLERSRGARHHICAEGVRVVLPAGGLLTDSEAKRLAWGILNDLAPDETIPVPDVVTYKEAQRLAVMRVLADGPARIDEVAVALSWGRRVTERRLHELLDGGRIQRFRESPRDVLFSLARAT